MSGVICLYGWNEKRVSELLPWVRAKKDRFVVVLETSSLFLLKKHFFPEIDIYIFNEENQQEVFEGIAWKYLFLPFSYEKPLDAFIRIQAEVNYRASDCADQGVQLFTNIQHNLKTDFYRAEDLFGKFKGVPAVICGAGPSLRKNGALLKQFASKGVIIAGGGAVQALKKIGVEPHFEAHVDPCSAHSFGETNNPTFFQLRSDMRAVSCAQGDKFLVGSNGNFPLETWLEEQLGVKSFDGGWTVGTFCASLAYHLGCDPIIFIGMDFAASGGHTYAEGVEGGKAEKREAVINKQGDVVYAQLDWVLAAEWLEKLALAKTDRTWINATEGGLGFSGIDDKLFQDVIDSLGQCQVFTKPCLEIMPKGNFLETLEDSLARSFRIIDEIFKEIEKIYPRAPQESGRCALLEHELAQESGYHHVLSPIWEIWKGVILRYNQDGEAGIFLHQMLFYKNLQPKLCQYVSY